MSLRLVAAASSTALHGIWLLLSEPMLHAPSFGGDVAALPLAVSIASSDSGAPTPVDKVVQQETKSRDAFLMPPSAASKPVVTIETAVGSGREVVKGKKNIPPPIDDIKSVGSIEQANVAAVFTEPEPVAKEIKKTVVVSQASYRAEPMPPDYPKLALRRQQTGRVLIQALVDVTGNTQELKLVSSSGFVLLDQSALRAVAKWQFNPAISDGRAVRAWIEVPIDFVIHK